MNKPILIAFDFDGVIADTISMLKETFAAFLRDYEIDYSDDLFEKYNGVTLSDMIADLKAQYNIAKSQEELLSDYQVRVNANAKAVKPTAGAVAALKSLRDRDICMKIRYRDDFTKLSFGDDNEEYWTPTTLIDDVESIKKLLEDKEVVITTRMILDQV